MPIHLTTGLPGGGKTLFTLVHVKALAEREQRPVFYENIKDLALPWIRLEDPLKWHECPEGAIIVLDECQDYLRPRANGATVPEHVRAFETHRHRGHDVFLITQHAMNIDANVRRLIGKHWHLVRKFGYQTANVHEWNQLKESPEKSRKDSVVTTFNYPKEAYGYYKSAEIHTVKAKMPTRVKLLLIVPLLVCGLGWWAWHTLNPTAYKQRITGMTPEQQQLLNAKQQQQPKRDWFADNTPRLPDFPYSAPKYDEITKPTIAPRPAACVLIRNKCTCYTQQATRTQTSDSVCRQIVENGFFQDFNDSPGTADHNNAENSPMQQTALTHEAHEVGETVAPAAVAVPAQQEARSPSNAGLEGIQPHHSIFNRSKAILRGGNGEPGSA